MTPTLGGVIPPMISPLDHQGQPDPGAIAALAAHILGGGCSGLFILGGYGEGAWLTREQRGVVITAAVTAAAGRVPVLVGMMLPGSGPAGEAARQAEDLGASVLVVGSPYYYGVDGAAQRRHVESILQVSSLPVMLYNIPSSTHNPLQPETVAALARDPRVLGIKDSAGDTENFKRFLAIKQAAPAFKVLQGHGWKMREDPPLVGDGMVPGLANIAPHLYVALWQAAHAGDAASCVSISAQLKDLETLESFGSYPIAAVKSAAASLGFGSGLPTAPFAVPDAADQKAIAAIAQRHQRSVARI